MTGGVTEGRSNMQINRYHKEQADKWNEFIAASKNGTFLLNRNYMDYHQERFTDASLMFYDEKQRLIAVLPANYEADIATVYSHHGLTYGGLIMSRHISTLEVMEAMQMACRYYAEQGAVKMYYRPIPYIIIGIHHKKTSSSSSATMLLWKLATSHRQSTFPMPSK